MGGTNLISTGPFAHCAPHLDQKEGLAADGYFPCLGAGLEDDNSQNPFSYTNLHHASEGKRPFFGCFHSLALVPRILWTCLLPCKLPDFQKFLISFHIVGKSRACPLDRWWKWLWEFPVEFDKLSFMQEIWASCSAQNSPRWPAGIPELLPKWTQPIFRQGDLWWVCGFKESWTVMILGSSEILWEKESKHLPVHLLHKPTQSSKLSGYLQNPGGND